jgi:hypothetical protein
LEASPLVAAGTNTVAVRLAGGGSRAYVGYRGFNDWKSSGVPLPRFTSSLEFGSKGWTGGAAPQTAAVVCSTRDTTTAATLAGVFWPGAPITIRSGDDAVAGEPAWKVELVGTVDSATFAKGVLTLVITDLAGMLNKPALPDTFTGAGGLQGGDDAVGRPKRRTYGQVFNVTGRLLDKAYNIFEFGDPERAGAVTSFATVKDKGRAGTTTTVAWAGSAAATLTALRNATPPNGGAAVAPSIACVKWWTTPVGPLTADLTGAINANTSPADLAADILADLAPTVAITNLATAIGWRNIAAGVHIDDPSETAAAVLDRLLAGVSLNWTLTAAGAIEINRWEWTAAIEAIVSQEVERQAIFPPLLSRKLGFQRNYRQHADSEISAALQGVGDLTYADGTPLEQLKPAGEGADQTATNIASSITGQGPGATAPGTAVLNSNITIGANGALTGGGGGSVTYGGLGGGALGLLGSLFFGSPLFLESSGGSAASLANFKTILGIAASITGQGAFATTNTAAYGSSLLTGFGALAPLGAINFGSPYLLEASGGAQATLTAFKTLLGIAASVTGQGPGATAAGTAVLNSNVTIGANGALLGAGGGTVTFGGIGGGDIGLLDTMAFGGPYLLEAAAGAAATLNNFKTVLGVAASVTGQGPGATAAGSAVLNSALSLAANGTLVGGGGGSVTYGGLGGGALGLLASLNFGSSYLLESAGGASATLVAFKTSQGVAASVAGQGALATLNSANYNTQVTGAGKPETYATSSDSLITNGDLLADAVGWSLSNAVRRAAGTEPAPYFEYTANVAGTATANDATQIPLMGAPKIWLSGSARKTAGAAGTLTVVANWFKADGTASAAPTTSLSIMPGTAAVWTRYSLTMVPPADAVSFTHQVSSAGNAATVFTASHRVAVTAPSADVTGANVAASVTGQGPGATAAGSAVLNSALSLSAAGALLGGGGGAVTYAGLGGQDLGLRDNINFGSPQLLESSGGVSASLVAFKTSQGVAASIAGQGSYATVSTVAYGSAMLTGFGTLAGASQARLGSTVADSGGTVLSNAQVITAQGIAASITGQGLLATKAYVQIGGAGNAATSSPLLTSNGFATSDPSIITNQGTAASISGQGPGATAPASNVLNSNLPAGENTIINSSFSRNGYGFNVQGFGQAGLNYPGYFGIRNVMYWRTNAVLAAGAQRDIGSLFGLWCGGAGNAKYMLQVTPGEVVGARFLVSHYRSAAPTLFILFYDINNTMFSAPSTSAGSVDSGAGDGGNLGQMSLTAIVPPNAVRAEWMLRMNGNGGTDPFVFFAEPWFGKMPTNVFPPWSPGPPDPDADRTLDNTAGGIAGQGIWATSGQISRATAAGGTPWFALNSFSLNYTITRQDGASIVTENLAITQLGVAAGFTGQGGLATKNQAGPNDLTPSAVQVVSYQVLQNAVICPVGN